MMEISDQDISVFLKGKETDENKRQILFDIFQKIKIEKSTVKTGDEIENEDIIRDKERTGIPKHLDDTDRTFLEDLLPWSLPPANVSA
ncbi:MAG: hypothetical protein NC341_01895 [Blautia sp.]|nr:hypothetical protein [Blautia sp.]MCM1200371.1 hypothetical protein [Bacteroides fragilis]